MKDITRQRKEAFGELGVASAPRTGLGLSEVVNILALHTLLNSSILVFNKLFGQQI